MGRRDGVRIGDAPREGYGRGCSVDWVLLRGGQRLAAKVFAGLV